MGRKKKDARLEGFNPAFVLAEDGGVVKIHVLLSFLWVVVAAEGHLNGDVEGRFLGVERLGGRDGIRGSTEGCGEREGCGDERSIGKLEGQKRR